MQESIAVQRVGIVMWSWTCLSSRLLQQKTVVAGYILTGHSSQIFLIQSNLVTVEGSVANKPFFFFLKKKGPHKKRAKQADRGFFFP